MTEAQQRKFISKVITDLGYDFSRGRLDNTVHPFATGINHNDVRLTTRWNEEDFSMGIFGVIHEAGTACMNKTLMKNLKERRSTKEHPWESMNRNLYSMRSLSVAIVIFGRNNSPYFQECAEGTFDDVSFETFYNALKFTQASLIDRSR